MSERLRTLLLEANGTHWAAVCIDTVGQGLFTASAESLPVVARSRTLRKLFGDRYADAAYLSDWREAFCRSRHLDVHRCNITNLIEFARNRRAIAEFDLIVVLHSAAGDRMSILSKTASWFQSRRGKLAMFVGNEYDLMHEKIAFANKAGADYICTQLPVEAARALYAGCSAAIVAMPHALNPHVYFPAPERRRMVDVGFVGDLYERLIGDRERTDIVTFFKEQGKSLGLRCDIRTTRMARAEWVEFLRSCLAVIGAESGTYFLQPDGAALNCAKAALRRDPTMSFDDVVRRCFADVRDAVNGKAISSRHFEPIGTMTCQLLTEGHYNGLLIADEHYIAVKRDLSNVRDAVQRVLDPACRQRITTAAYEHVMAAHTYDHRVDRLVDVVCRGTTNRSSDVAVA